MSWQKEGLSPLKTDFAVTLVAPYRHQDMFSSVSSDRSHEDAVRDMMRSPQSSATTEYCQKLQQWMWHYYWRYASWQSLVALSTLPFPPLYDVPPHGTSTRTARTPASTGQQAFDSRNWYNYPYPLSLPASPEGAQTYQTLPTSQTAATDARAGQHQNGIPLQPGIIFGMHVKAS